MNRVRFEKWLSVVKSKISDLLQTFLYEDLNAEYLKRDLRTRTLVGIFLGLLCVVMSVMNVVSGYYFMAATTGFLTLGFFASAFAVGVLKNRKIFSVIIAVMLVVILSVYALMGGNSGFAILWITLVPLLSLFGLGFRAGFAVSLYFQFFLVAIFYTPVREKVSQYYTNEFMRRYPILYLAGFIISLLFIYKILFYQKRVEITASTDALTGLGNRLLFNEKVKDFSSSQIKQKVTLFVFDVNFLKHANDNLGHDAGDEIIIGAADCIKKTFYKAYIVARVGGDEFCVIMLSDKCDAEKLRQNFIAIVKQWKGVKVDSLSVACGYAVSNGEKIDIGSLMKDADKSMYEHKAMLKSSGNPGIC